MGKTREITISENYFKVKEAIVEAAHNAGRDPDEVRLVVVTKAHPVEIVEAAVAAGARHLGENYADEAVSKIAALRGRPDLTWHMIGHVQRRKAALVSRNFDYMHSLDNLRLARRLNRFLEADDRRLPILLEYNVTAEETKFGWPAWNEANWSGFLPEIDELLTLDRLDIQGVMTIGPFLSDPEAIRPYYRKLRQLRDYLAKCYPEVSWGELSMGMSGDFRVAIEEGATIVRVGQAILGPRPPKV